MPVHYIQLNPVTVCKPVIDYQECQCATTNPVMKHLQVCNPILDKPAFQCHRPSLSCTTPAIQYQTQKVIQNTVRTSSSIYTSNLAGVSVYQPPKVSLGVNWNQSSDRRNPHGNGRGNGVDIKYNSYARYLNRIKGKHPYRAQPIPPRYGNEYIPFNPAFPIYGNKTIKTAFFDCPCKLV